MAQVLDSKNRPTLIYCGSCHNTETWERFPERDMLYESGRIAQYAYKCRLCEHLTFYDYEPALTVGTEGNQIITKHTAHKTAQTAVKRRNQAAGKGDIRQ